MLLSMRDMWSHWTCPSSQCPVFCIFPDPLVHKVSLFDSSFAQVRVSKTIVITKRRPLCYCMFQTIWMFTCFRLSVWHPGVVYGKGKFLWVGVSIFSQQEGKRKWVIIRKVIYGDDAAPKIGYWNWENRDKARHNITWRRLGSLKGYIQQIDERKGTQTLQIEEPIILKTNLFSKWIFRCQAGLYFAFAPSWGFSPLLPTMKHLKLLFRE